MGLFRPWLGALQWLRHVRLERQKDGTWNVEKGRARSPLLFVSVIDARKSPLPLQEVNFFGHDWTLHYYFLKLIFYFKCSKQGQVSHQVFFSSHHFYLFSESNTVSSQKKLKNSCTSWWPNKKAIRMKKIIKEIFSFAVGKAFHTVCCRHDYSKDLALCH